MEYCAFENHSAWWIARGRQTERADTTTVLKENPVGHTVVQVPWPQWTWGGRQKWLRPGYLLQLGLPGMFQAGCCRSQSKKARMNGTGTVLGRRREGSPLSPGSSAFSKGYQYANRKVASKACSETHFYLLVTSWVRNAFSLPKKPLYLMSLPFYLVSCGHSVLSSLKTSFVFPLLTYTDCRSIFSPFHHFFFLPDMSQEAELKTSKQIQRGKDRQHKLLCST